MLAIRVLLSALCQRLVCMGACFGTESAFDDEPFQSQMEMSIKDQHNVLDKNWLSSSNGVEEVRDSKCEQENTSPVSTCSPTISNLEALQSSADAPYVNNGFLQWNQQRRMWLGDGPRLRTRRTSEPAIRTAYLRLLCWQLGCSWGASYESLLGSSRPFAKPIPLPEMVHFLVRVWEHEGLYD